MSQKLGGVIGCNASGGKQEAGAVIGGLLGAVAGNKLAKNDRGTGTAIGAVVEARARARTPAARCRRNRAAENAGGYYVSDGVRVANTRRRRPDDQDQGQVASPAQL